MKKFFLHLLLIASVVTDAQPKLIGTLTYHGSMEGGSVFRYNLPTTGPGIIYSFNNQSPHTPAGGVCAGDGSWLYGCTLTGGVNNSGAFYRVQQNGTLFTKLYDLSSGNGYRMIPYYHTDGYVYFTDNDLIKKYNTANGSISSISALSPIQARNLYIDANDWIYYTEIGFPNRLVKMKTDGSSWTLLHNFNASTDGEQVSVGITETPGDSLFGAFTYGGLNNGGTLYSIKKDGSGFIVHHQFTSATGTLPESKLVYFDGKLYGTTLAGGDYGQGVLFCINADGSNYRVLRHLGLGESGWTEATLGNIAISSNARIFGSFRSLLLSSFNYYRLFKVDTSGSNFAPIFTGNSQRDNGDGQQDILLLNDQTIFFTTYSQGRNDGGVLNISDTSGNGNPLYHFGNSPNGFRPAAGLIKATDGKLYGTTTIGGASGDGVIFSMNADGTGYTKLHEFSDAEGYEPSGKLLEASDGKLYGACRNGGPAGFGSLFRINKNGTGFQVIYDYSSLTGGYSPVGGLVEDAGGILYGVNFWGEGSVFKINKNGSNYTELKVFSSSSEGLIFPYNGLSLKGNYLYGEAGYGGPDNMGGLYRIKTDGTGFQVLHEFNGTDGELPVGTPIIASNGKLYGTTANGGTNGSGVIYRIDSTGTNFTVLRHLAQPDGTSPWTALIQASDGLVYGGTQIAGSDNGGTLFKMNLDGSGFTILKNFSSTEGQGVGSLLDLNGNFIVLPVQFLSFTAQRSGEKVLLNWKTSNERNADRFDVERSTNGVSYHTIGTVHASGNSISVVNYSFDDPQPSTGLNYYRLKQIDVDGSNSYAKVVSVRFDKNALVLLMPNPAKDVLTIQLLRADIFNSVSVFDASGRMVLKQNLASASTQLNIQHLAPGRYIAVLNGKENEQYSFVKQ